jgi:mRNA-decapping enzyme subunit 2
LISETENSEYQVLLVQSYWSKCSWGFPKGKINENEDPAHCAIREVYEETGYDITKLINPNEYIELVINLQYTRLYLVPDVPQKTVFEPKTRNEIKCCKW